MLLLLLLLLLLLILILILLLCIVSSLLDKDNGITLNDSNNNATIILLYEAGYSHLMDDLKTKLMELTEMITVDSINVVIATLPPCADLKNWEPTTLSSNNTTESLCYNKKVLIGGLLLSQEYIDNDTTVFCYIGDKDEQLSGIYMRLGDRNVMSYSPQNQSICVKKGSDLRQFNERYGGVSKVREAKIIGIIIGSMGLTEELTRNIIDRLKKLIHAAKKSYYVLVMGRLHEAKLHNFPQVDVYCLVRHFMYLL